MPSMSRVVLLSAGALVGVLAVGAGAAVATTDGEVPRGTTVGAVDIGGLSRSAAVARLDRSFDAELSSAITLVADEEQLELDPAKAGLALDAEATVAEAMRPGVVDRVLSLVNGSPDVEPVAAVDEAALRTELQRLAKSFDRDAREGAVRFDDEAKPVQVLPLTGRRLEVDEAADTVAASFLDKRVEVPAQVTPVKTTEADVRRVHEGIAVPAVAAPIVVQAGGKSVTVSPADIAKSLKLEPDEQGRIEPKLDDKVLLQRLQTRLKRIGTPAVDATFDVSKGTPVVVPSKTGQSIAPPDLVTAVRSVLTATAPRKATAPLTVSQPRVTTEIAQGLGVREVIGKFTTRHPCCRPRVQNIHRIADIVDGYVLRPGDRFDLNAVVGPRDKARGFTEAPQILEGQFVDRVGGGVSQFATTIFNAVFFSGLKDITHTPHSYYISRYPPGREATVSFPQPDLIFENDSPNGVLVKTSYTGTSITVTFWGTKRFEEVRSLTGPRTRLRDFTTEYVEREDCTATAGEKGFDIVVTRVFVDGGREVKRERFRTRYKPEPRFICGPPPKRRS